MAYWTFAIYIEGIRFAGDWSVVGRELSMRSAYGGITRPLGRRKPERLAEDLLREVLRQRLEEGCLTPPC